MNGNATSTGTAAPSSTSVASSSWKAINNYSGQTFFTAADLTSGNVQYVDQSTAQSAGLIEINSNGNAVMRVETTPQVQTNRQSVRITTQATFDGGLVVMDAVHMPTGCATWPAFWTNGPNWPAGGEIDIIEGVSNYTNNQATIHTNPGCTLPSTNSALLNMSGTLVASTDCSAAQTGNQGCGIRSNSSVSFASGFNGIGGGVYAMLWDNSGIKVYGVGMTAYDALRVSDQCTSIVEGYIIRVISIVAAEALLVIRTWAFWQRSKKLLIGLLVYGVLSIIAAIAADLTPTMLIPGEEPPLGTCYFESTRNAAIVYLILAIFESVMLILNVYKRVHDYKEFESGLVVTLYHGGMFYMVCILAVTLANVIFEGALPSAYSNMFNSLQLVVHSVLASRILFRLRDSNERVRVPSMLVMTLDAQVN